MEKKLLFINDDVLDAKKSVRSCWEFVAFFKRMLVLDSLENTRSRPAVVSLVDQLVILIRDSIITGELAPAERIIIKKIAKKYNVSVIPVREALARLLPSHLVEVKANHGYCVARPPTKDEFTKFVEARSLFETSVVELGFSNAKKKDIEKLFKSNEKMKRVISKGGPKKIVKWQRLNHEFHRTLIGLARNDFLLNVYDDLSFGNLQFQLLRSSSIQNIKLEQLIAEHESMIEALKSKQLIPLLNKLESHIKALKI